MADDLVHFSAIKDHTQELVSGYKDRNDLFNAIEEIFLMDWKGKPDVTNYKITISPSGRNQALGAIRLMTATEPTFTVPRDKNNPDVQGVSDDMEMFCNALLENIGRIRNNPVGLDVVYSGVLFGEVHIAQASTKDLLEQAKGGSPSALKRMETISETTPIIYDVYDPRTGYPEFDAFGLAAYFRKVEKLSGEILDAWGAKAVETGLDPSKRFDKTVICEYWDYQDHIVWLEGKDLPLFMGENPYPVIPISAQIVDGSLIHAITGAKRQPFLYTLQKSGFWERENLSYTTMYTNIFALATGATFGYEAENEGKKIAIDWSVPGGYATWKVGEKFGQIPKQIVDPGLQIGMQTAKDVISESTIYPTALGQPVGSNAPFSATSLLNQMGRLPLTTIQKKCSWVLADAMKTSLIILKENKGSVKLNTDKGVFSLDTTDIPKSVSLNCVLDIKLPQDDRQNSMVALQLTGGDRPLVTQEYALENILGVEQPRKMKEAVWEEKFADMQANLKFQLDVQREQAKFQIEMQKLQQQAMAQQQPIQGQQPMQGAPAEMPPGVQMPEMPPNTPQGEGLMGAIPGSQGGRPPMTPQDSQTLSQLAGAPGNGLADMPLSYPGEEQ